MESKHELESIYYRARMNMCAEDHSRALEASHEPQTADHRSCWETASSRANRGARRLSHYFAAGQQQQLSVGPALIRVRHWGPTRGVQGRRRLGCTLPRSWRACRPWPVSSPVWHMSTPPSSASRSTSRSRCSSSFPRSSPPVDALTRRPRTGCRVWPDGGATRRIRVLGSGGESTGRIGEGGRRMTSGALLSAWGVVGFSGRCNIPDVKSN
jgi:hypothetical protein